MPIITAGEARTIERHAELLLALSDSQLRRQVSDPGSDLIQSLELGRDGPYQQFWIPFDAVNEAADVVIVGLTPGLQQAEEALVSMRNSLLMGCTPEIVAQRAKTTAAFKGNMRSLGARLMDHFGINELLGLGSTEELFGSAAHRVHCTSLLRHPVLKDGKNYSGDARMLQRPFLRDIAFSTLPNEIARIGDPWIISFGTAAADGLQALADMGRIDFSRLLTGILHPSGTQWNRYKVQFGTTPADEAANVPGGLDVIERSERLREKVRKAISSVHAARSNR